MSGHISRGTHFHTCFKLHTLVLDGSGCVLQGCVLSPLLLGVFLEVVETWAFAVGLQDTGAVLFYSKINILKFALDIAFDIALDIALDISLDIGLAAENQEDLLVDRIIT